MACPILAHRDLPAAGPQQICFSTRGGLIACGLIIMSVMACMCMYGMGLYSGQVLDAVELFAGSAEVTGALQRVALIHRSVCRVGYFVGLLSFQIFAEEGHLAAPYDIMDNPISMDLATAPGFAWGSQKLFQYSPCRPVLLSNFEVSNHSCIIPISPDRTSSSGLR